MQSSSLYAVGAIYFLLVAHFYNESNGFLKNYTATYALWKVVPIVFLMLYTAVDGGGLSKKDRLMCALGLLFGGIGDVVIGIHHDGIIPGAVSFGIGHLLYMTQLTSGKLPKLFWPLIYFVIIWGLSIGQIVVIPHLLDRPIASAIMISYSTILSACLILTSSQYIHRKAGEDEKALYLRFLGFLLFYISDSVLALDHAGYNFPLAEHVVLGTYYTAQFLILSGNIQWDVSMKAKHA